MTVEQRTKAVHLRRDEYDVRIDRRSPWGNPFVIGGKPPLSRADVIRMFAYWVTGPDAEAVWIREHVHELRGKRLGCWCAPLACHGDVLAAMAEEKQ